ncbi:hypothetical protein AAFF_G00105020 [Aldrovandia affinis]|uniref:Uncharacterized protein n=1 Tax=Aldrovandia affinis TaxID=143900 RepID=A0AAD7WXR8_9TELE|nr:hypothetical protein AAFF_G00105020 [Aldrovandia affinis]
MVESHLLLLAQTAHQSPFCITVIMRVWPFGVLSSSCHMDTFGCLRIFSILVAPEKISCSFWEEVLTPMILAM